MGRVNFGAKILEKEGQEFWVPEITISVNGSPDIVFTSNMVFGNSDEVEEFTHHIYKILSGPRDDVHVYPQGTHGAGLN